MVIGDNAQGKTNFLEALYFISRRTSPRRAIDSDLIHWGEEKAYCGASVVDGPVTFTRELIIRMGKRKEWKWNGCEEPRRGERNTIWLVGFFPHDIDIVDGPPQLRRDFLDQAIGFIYPAHEMWGVRYSKALFRRNLLLRERADKDLILVYTEQLIEAGGKIIRGRTHYLRALAPHLAEVYFRLAGGKGKVGVEYEPSKPGIGVEVERDLREAYARYEGEEREKGMTLVGPHRDEPIFFNEGKEFKSFASQGEKKTLALALKLAEMAVMREVKKRDVIALLDDVFSELDRNRRQYLLQGLLTGGQVIFSATDLDEGQDFSGGRLTRFFCQGGNLLLDG